MEDSRRTVRLSACLLLMTGCGEVTSTADEIVCPHTSASMCSVSPDQIAMVRAVLSDVETRAGPAVSSASSARLIALARELRGLVNDGRVTRAQAVLEEMRAVLGDAIKRAHARDRADLSAIALAVAAAGRIVE